MSPKKLQQETLTDEAAARRIAAFAQELTFEDIPESTVNHAKKLLLMGISWSLLGVRKQGDASILQILGRAGHTGASTVFGTDCRASCADAAFANAVHAQIYDCNDGHSTRGAYHAGRVLIPSVCSVAEHLHASGKSLLTALIFGYEIAHRTYLDTPRSRSDGIGAAAAAGQLLHLSADQFVNALFLADQHGPHLYPGPGNFNSDANHICNGMIARTAVESAFLAKKGLTADKGYSTLHLDGDLPEAGDEKLFLAGQIYIKPFIACRYLHNAIEMALAFRAAHHELIGDIERIDINVVMTAEFVAQHVPPDAYFKTAHFSIPYNVACALLDGEIDERQSTPERIAADDVQGLQEKVAVQLCPRNNSEFPADSYPTDMKISLKDGRTFSDSKLFPKGSVQNPLSNEEISVLFCTWAGGTITKNCKEQVIGMVSHLEDSNDVRELTGLLYLGETAGLDG